MTNSSLRRIVISNIGPFGSLPIEIDLSDIVCLVGQNNSGKSTVLDCYQMIFDKTISPLKINKSATSDPYVELWVEFPFGTPNVSDQWICTNCNGMSGIPIVRSRWTWSRESFAVERTTWDESAKEFSGKASGLDNVFQSRLPKPLRIGALDQPEKEKDGLLKIVLEPLAKDLKSKADDMGSAFGKSVFEMKQALNNEVNDYKTLISEIQNSLHEQYNSIFDSHNVHIKIEPQEQFVDFDAYLKKASDIFVGENGHLFHIKSQGTGSQRTLFWSLLRVRSALQAKIDANLSKQKEIKDRGDRINAFKVKISKLENLSKKLTSAQQLSLVQLRADLAQAESDNTDVAFERGYILMIDEPEIALHPSAVRLAKTQLYNLAKDAGWQVMITTHHPAFIDPTEDHTTIVRVDRYAGTAQTYCSDLERFDEDEKGMLRALIKFDVSFSEIFFSKEVIVVEGDTEYAVLQDFFDMSGERTPKNDRLVVRAGGKGTIPLILRILRQFKIPHGVLHDVDSPKTKRGKKNSAYAVNESILLEVEKSAAADVKVHHCVSVPNFELNHSVFSSGDGKPLDVVRRYKSDIDFRNVVTNLGEQLTGKREIVQPGSEYRNLLSAWISNEGLGNEKKYAFD